MDGKERTVVSSKFYGERKDLASKEDGEVRTTRGQKEDSKTEVKETRRTSQERNVSSVTNFKEFR